MAVLETYHEREPDGCPLPPSHSHLLNAIQLSHKGVSNSRFLYTIFTGQTEATEAAYTSLTSGPLCINSK